MEALCRRAARACRRPWGGQLLGPRIRVLARGLHSLRDGRVLGSGPLRTLCGPGGTEVFKQVGKTPAWCKMKPVRVARGAGELQGLGVSARAFGGSPGSERWFLSFWTGTSPPVLRPSDTEGISAPACGQQVLGPQPPFLCELIHRVNPHVCTHVCVRFTRASVSCRFWFPGEPWPVADDPAKACGAGEGLARHLDRARWT